MDIHYSNLTRAKNNTLQSKSHSNRMNFVKHQKVTKYAKAVSKREKKKSSFKKGLVKALYIFLGFVFFVCIVGVVGAGIYLKQIEKSLPDTSKFLNRPTDLSTQIFDRKGTLLYTFYGDENREFVKVEDIPEKTKMAVIAAEDVTFYEHKGVDVQSVIRAGLQYFHIISGSSGGSTITQELVRNTILKDTYGDDAYTRTPIRKLKEMLVTLQFEQTRTKDQILQLYLNEVFMGGVNYGLQSASKAYFGKDVRQLDLAESALLAGLIQAPGAYNPVNGTDPVMAKIRQEYVLDQMLKHSSLTGVTQEEVDKAKAEKLVYKSVSTNILAPHFVFYIKQQLDKMFGPDKVVSGGLKVKTTLDYSMQKIAQDEVKKGINAHGLQWGVRNGAAVAINPKNGDILVMVGSIDYNSKNPRIDGNVNVTLASRQMGSSVKPYTYLTAFSQGYGPWLETPDVSALKFGAYKLTNSDDGYKGLMVARQALITSRNIPAVYTIQLVGVENFLKTAKTLGITTLTDTRNYGLSLTLGAGGMNLLEHTEAYTVFANGGIKRDYRSILSVKDSDGNTLYTAPDNPGTRVWDEKEVYMLNWILCDLGGFGDQPMNSMYSLNGKRSFCGKTGTTTGPRDLTSMMYSKSLVVGFWSGNNDNTPTPGAWSTTVPLYMANGFMTRMAGKYKPETFVRPAGITSGSVCNDTGMLATKSNPCKKVQTVYVTDKAPKTDKRESIYVCKANGKVSTNEAFSRANGLGTVKYVLDKKMENTLQQTNYENYVKSHNGGVYLFVMPDSGDCPLPVGPDQAPVIKITSPANSEAVYPGLPVTISASANSGNPISKVEFLFDGFVINIDSSAGYAYTYTIPVGTSAGTHTITAIVTDNTGKTASSAVNVNVMSSALSVSITSPISGASIAASALPYTMNADGSGLNEVDFIITGVGGFSRVLYDTTSYNGWSASLSTIGVGDYQVVARGIKGSTTVLSSPVSFKIVSI